MKTWPLLALPLAFMPPSGLAAAADFLPTVFRPEPPTLSSPCANPASGNAQAQLARVWFAQTHLMEPTWPFFNLVQDRGALLKVDVSAPAGTGVPQVSVTARWADGRQQTRCMVAPSTLPTRVDMNPQPQRQSLASSYRLTLPSAWMTPDLSLTIRVAGGPSRSYSAEQLRLNTRPQLEMVLTNLLLFGDTRTPNGDAVRAEFAARFPFTSVAFYRWPQALRLPKLVVGPRTDALTPDGQETASPAVWADRLPSCTEAEQSAGTCTPYSGFGVLSSTYRIMSWLKHANGMGWTSVWYGALGPGSAIGGGLGGGQQATGDGYGQVFNHEVGHALSLPHLGGVTGAHQTDPDDLLDPYTGDTADGSDFRGGGFGKTTAYDPLDNTLMHWGCRGTLVEAQDPMQRECNNVAKGRRFDHFSDFATVQMQRYWTGTRRATGGTVPYWSRFLPGSSAANPQATAFHFPQESGTVQAEWAPGATAPTLTRYNPGTRTQQIVLRPPGDDGFVKTLPKAPAGSVYDRYYDFRFPLQFNVPVVTVLGTFNASDHRMSSVLSVVKTRGHLKRLWDPTDRTTFALMKRSISGDTFWWGWNLHLKAEYTDGTQRHVALDSDVDAGSDPMAGFTYWAVNLPDDGRTLQRLTLMHRPLCVRNGAASERQCDIGLDSNGLTAANLYQAAQIATVWTP